MTDNNRNHLRALAEAATPGPWERTRLPGFQHAPTALYRVEDGDGHQVADCYDNRVCSDERAEQDAAFIAAASPQAVIALLDENERLRACLRDTHGFLRGCARRPELGSGAVDLVEQADMVAAELRKVGQ